jgi:hypothetical protein
LSCKTHYWGKYRKDRSDGITKEKCKQLLDAFKETRGYQKLKEGKLDCTVWRIHFARGYGHSFKKEDGMNKAAS